MKVRIALRSLVGLLAILACAILADLVFDRRSSVALERAASGPWIESDGEGRASRSVELAVGPVVQETSGSQAIRSLAKPNALEGNGYVSGVVLDAKSGRRISGASILATISSTTALGAGGSRLYGRDIDVAALQSDALGRFQFDPSPWNRVRLSVAADGYATHLVGRASKGKELVLKLQQARRIEGKVIAPSGDKFVECVEVEIRAEDGGNSEWIATASCNPSGGFFLDVEPGLYSATVHSLKFPPLYFPGIDVRLQDLRDLVLALHVGLEIKGIVSTPSGDPIFGARVRLADKSRPTRTTDVEGKFSFALWPGEDVVVSASAEGFSTSSLRTGPVLQGKDDLVISLGVGAEVRGGVNWNYLGPSAGVAYLLSSGTRSGPSLPHLVRDVNFQELAPDGSFSFLGVQTALHSALLLISRSGQRRFLWLPDVNESETLDIGKIDLLETGGIRGAIVTEDGLPVAGIELGLTWNPTHSTELLSGLGSGQAYLSDLGRVYYAKTDSDGVFAFEDLEQGSGDVVIQEDGYPMVSLSLDALGQRDLGNIYPHGSGGESAGSVIFTGEPISVPISIRLTWVGGRTESPVLSDGGFLVPSTLPEGVLIEPQLVIDTESGYQLILCRVELLSVHAITVSVPPLEPFTFHIKGSTPKMVIRQLDASVGMDEWFGTFSPDSKGSFVAYLERDAYYSLQSHPGNRVTWEGHPGDRESISNE